MPLGGDAPGVVAATRKQQGWARTEVAGGFGDQAGPKRRGHSGGICASPGDNRCHDGVVIAAGGIVFGVGLLWLLVFYLVGADVPVMNTIGGTSNALVNLLIALFFMGIGGVLLLIGVLIRVVSRD